MTGASVLVVDDDIAALACARRTLVEAGYEVREALNGRRALQQVVASPPNLLLTDILMPDGDGIELINAVRRAFPAIPIIAMSERRHLGKLDLLNLATKIGADAVLEKPLEAARLLADTARLTHEVQNGETDALAKAHSVCESSRLRPQSC